MDSIFQHLDCGISDLIAEDECSQKCVSCNWEAYFRIPSVLIFTCQLGRNPVSVLSRPNSCRKFRSYFSVEELPGCKSCLIDRDFEGPARVDSLPCAWQPTANQPQLGPLPQRKILEKYSRGRFWKNCFWCPTQTGNPLTYVQTICSRVHSMIL